MGLAQAGSERPGLTGLEGWPSLAPFVTGGTTTGAGQLCQVASKVVAHAYWEGQPTIRLVASHHRHVCADDPCDRVRRPPKGRATPDRRDGGKPGVGGCRHCG